MLTLTKHKKDILFLLTLSFIVLPAFVAAIAFAQVGSFLPGAVTFDNTEMLNSDTEVVRFTNTSSGDITGTVTAVGEFTCIANCSYTNLAPGAFITSTLAFTPPALGVYSDTAAFSTGSGASPSCSATQTGGASCANALAESEFENFIEHGYEDTYDVLSTVYEEWNLDITNCTSHTGMTPDGGSLSGICDVVGEFITEFYAETYTVSEVASSVITCDNGTWVDSGTPPPPPPPPSNCSLDAVTVNHGDSYNFFSDSNPLSPTQCTDVDLVRTCNDGVLSGSNTFDQGTCVDSAPPITSCLVTISALISGTGFPSIALLLPGETRTWSFPDTAHGEIACITLPAFPFKSCIEASDPVSITYTCG